MTFFYSAFCIIQKVDRKEFLRHFIYHTQDGDWGIRGAWNCRAPLNIYALIFSPYKYDHFT